MAYELCGYRPIGKKFGEYHLSLFGETHRARVGRERGAVQGPLGWRFIQEKVDRLAQDHIDALIQVSPAFIPFELKLQLQRCELELDFNRFCRALVFCTHIEEAFGGKYIPGFVIDQIDSPNADPFNFPKADVAALAVNYLENPRSAIFVNYRGRDLNPLAVHELIPEIAHLLGYLISHETLDIDSENPGRFLLKESWAATYATQHTVRLGRTPDWPLKV